MVSHRWIQTRTSLFRQEKNCFSNWICKCISHAQLGYNLLHQMPAIQQCSVPNALACRNTLTMSQIFMWGAVMVWIFWDCRVLQSYMYAGSHEGDVKQKKCWAITESLCSSGTVFFNWTWPLMADIHFFNDKGENKEQKVIFYQFTKS